METINPIYNLGRVAVKDESTERMSYYEVRENTASGGNIATKQKLLRFRIDDLNSYLLLSRSYLQLRMKLKRNDGSNLLDADVNCAFKNGLHSIFRRASLRINGQSVNEYSDWHYWKQDLEAVFMPEAWKKSAGNALHYFSTTETNDVMADAATNTTAAASTALVSNEVFGQVYSGIQPDLNDSFSNKSFRQRCALARRSHEVNACIPLHMIFTFLKAYDRVMRGMQVEIELELADDVNIVNGITALGGNTALSWAWEGQGATLFVKRVVPSLRVRSSLNDAISKGFSLNGFSFEDVALYRYAENTTNSNATNDWRISTTVSRPTRVFVAFQVPTRNVLAKNTGYFDQNAVKSIQLFINGQPIPDLRYEVNLPESTVGGNTNAFLVIDNGNDKRDRQRAYMNLIALSGMDASPLTDELMNTTVSYGDWLNKYPIYAFDVANNLPADTAFTGASEILVRYTLGNNLPCEVIAWVYHEKLADIKFTSTESSIVIS